MTVKQALKYKNKLVSKMNDEFRRASQYNSVEEGVNRPYGAEVSLNNFINMSNELVELKTKIHLANVKVYDKIFLLSELKSRVSKLQMLDCSEGKVSDRYGRMTGEHPAFKTVEINILKKDEMIAELESKIEELQEVLDVHNATTEI